MTHREDWAGDKRGDVCNVASQASPGICLPLTPPFLLLLPFFLLDPSVEDRNPRLLSQYARFAHWLQDRPANRPEYSDGAVPPEAGAHLL